MQAKAMTVKEASVEMKAAMLKALAGKPWGTNEQFECPLCGGKAAAYSSLANGRRGARCLDCHFRVLERGC